MKYKILVLSLLIIINVILFSDDAKPRYTGQTINDILELPEEEIDLGLACLVLAKEFYPDIDINFYLKLIDGYAYNVKKINKGLEQPEARIGALNTCLYRKGKWNNNQFFEYDLDDLKGELRKNKFLNTYLDTKKGSCTTMPMLYLVIAQRLGWPIYAVIAPMHFFCRYVDPDFKENNIEPTVGGGYDDDLRYINEMGTTARTIENGVYMRTLSNKEYLGRLLIINALEYRKLGNIDKAISYLDTAVQIDSTDSGAIWNLCVCFYEKAKVLNKKMEFELQALQIEKELYETGMKKNEHLLYQHPNRSSIVAKGAQDIINAHGSGLDYHSTNNQDLIQQNSNTIYYEIHYVRNKYIPEINYWMELSREYKKKAEDIGIVLELPEIYFEKQAEDIIKFIERGGYE